VFTLAQDFRLLDFSLNYSIWAPDKPDKTFFEYGFVFGEIFDHEIGFFVVNRVNDTADLMNVVPLPRLTKKSTTPTTSDGIHQLYCIDPAPTSEKRFLIKPQSNIIPQSLLTSDKRCQWHPWHAGCVNDTRDF
jgi:hypothetical protein